MRQPAISSPWSVRPGRDVTVERPIEQRGIDHPRSRPQAKQFGRQPVAVGLKPDDQFCRRGVPRCGRVRQPSRRDRGRQPLGRSERGFRVRFGGRLADGFTPQRLQLGENRGIGRHGRVLFLCSRMVTPSGSGPFAYGPCMGYGKWASLADAGKLPTAMRSQLPTSGRFGQRLNAMNRDAPIHPASVNQHQQPAFSQPRQSVRHGPATATNSASDVCRARSDGSVFRITPEHQPRQRFRPR